ncbi:MAG: ribulose-phosphate 3-epimerase [Clostridia bacterium]|nr:ribulose-phosphate 3-epimerase [Clostridia bacterium]
MAIISPSILSADFCNLESEFKKVKETGAKWLHVDCMDGAFVPNMSFGYAATKSIRNVTDMVLDVHMMIDRPIRYVDQFCEAGADYLTIHVEADTPENTAKAIEKIKSHGVKVGLSVKPKTPAEAVLPYIKDLDLILVMTVEPGFGNQKFMEDMMPKLKALREMINEHKPSCHLEVDGGINLETGDICKKNGADVLVSGSSYFKALDKIAFVKEIES